MVRVRHKAKFRIGQEIEIRPERRQEWPALSGEFTVLGVGDSAAYHHLYLIENIKNPYHPTCWVPEAWLTKASEVTIPEGRC